MFDIKNPMAPPWLMYPHIGRLSIGWRMGYGESYIYAFGNWFSSLSSIDQTKYSELFPEPIGWQGWYEEEFVENDIYDEDGYLIWNMKLNLEVLQKEYQDGKKFEYLFFWGHQPSSDGSITNSCFSQWWKSEFKIETDNYCCMEQYMMAEKARLFNDQEMLTKIMESNDPKQIKAYGRKVKNFDEATWKRRRTTIVLSGNLAKFIQNRMLMEFILSTDDKILVEASPFDKVWGIGMQMGNNEIHNPMKWMGLNLLGFALTEVREEIRRICKNIGLVDFSVLHKEFD